MALLRVGIDSGSGGMDGPLFADGAFEFVPIPDSSTKLNERTYGNQMARAGNPLSDFFPPARRTAMSFQSMHLDPEFTSFTYGDPTSPKAGLRYWLRATYSCSMLDYVDTTAKCRRGSI